MNQSIKLVSTLALGITIGVVSSNFAPGILKHYADSNQPYADQQGRSISSLSASDIEELRNGSGWGLAKPAEFNGYPGPSHVIEFADQLALDGAQRAAVEGAFDRMKAKARQLGEALIDAERALDSAFIKRAVTQEELDRLLVRAENVRAKLRSVHLSAHLEITPLLNIEQKAKYVSLRGYGNGHAGHTGNH